MNWELTIRPAETPQRPACAWFIPGATARDWLAAVAEVPVDASRVRLPLRAVAVRGLLTGWTKSATPSQFQHDVILALPTLRRRQ